MSNFREEMIIGEEEFTSELDKSILPWVSQFLKEDYFTCSDGFNIHYYYAVNPCEKASIVISHGFCEFVSKYHEVMYYFYQMGYSVFLLEYRGHGFSQRCVDSLDKVYVKNYDEYVTDLSCFVEYVVKKQSLTNKYFLYAHSMGGCIATLFLEQYPNIFSKAVLSAPMMKMYYNVPEWSVSIAAKLAVILGKSKEFAFGQKGFDKIPVHQTSSSLSKTRYDYVFSERLREPHYTTYGGTFGWVNASVKAMKKLHKDASKIKTPILLFQAGKDTLVNPEGHNAFIKETNMAKLVVYQESKHEIYNAFWDVRVDYFRRIFEWLEE